MPLQQQDDYEAPLFLELSRYWPRSYWTKTLIDTEDPDIQRVEIDVRRDENEDSQVYASLVSLLPTYFNRGN